MKKPRKTKTADYSEAFELLQLRSALAESSPGIRKLCDHLLAIFENLNGAVKALDAGMEPIYRVSIRHHKALRKRLGPKRSAQIDR